LKAKEGDQKTKLFQFLNLSGAKALRFHMGRVQEMAESSPDRYTHEREIVDRFGGQHELELIAPAPGTVPEAGDSLGPLFEHAEAKEAAN
jgi:hypothetical protein